MSKVLTAHQIFKENRVYWVKTYKTLLKYISDDFKNILKPTSTGRDAGKRYFIKEENLNNFIKKFEEGEL